MKMEMSDLMKAFQKAFGEDVIIDVVDDSVLQNTKPVLVHSQKRTPLTKIVKVFYKWGVRYWCFGEKFVIDVYDEDKNEIYQNDFVAWEYDDMTVQELMQLDAGKYALEVITGEDAVELYALLVAVCN